MKCALAVQPAIARVAGYHFRVHKHSFRAPIQPAGARDDLRVSVGCALTWRGMTSIFFATSRTTVSDPVAERNTPQSHLQQKLSIENDAPRFRRKSTRRAS